MESSSSDHVYSVFVIAVVISFIAILDLFLCTLAAAKICKCFFVCRKGRYGYKELFSLGIRGDMPDTLSQDTPSPFQSPLREEQTEQA